MTDLFNQYPYELRIAIFSTVLILMALLESLLPRRIVCPHRQSRWPSNIGIVILDSLLARIILPVSAITVALYAEANQIGLFKLTRLSPMLTIIFSLLILDVLIYAQHIIFHKVPLLWRFHRMHHSDTHIDVTTGIRFHPLEIILSLVIKFAIILVFGIPVLGILLFEIVLNMTAMITHSNVKIPNRIDQILRFIFVTPDMHRVHHSTYKDETNSNYGFNLSVWDRLFETYIDQPKDKHENMQIGLNQFRAPREQYLDKMLTQPFRNTN